MFNECLETDASDNDSKNDSDSDRTLITYWLQLLTDDSDRPGDRYSALDLF